MANIRDVAQLAGVSISSVSNFLNNRSDRMSEATRLRIQKCMAELNYSAKRVIMPTEKDQAKTLGLLVPSILNPSFSALAHQLDLAARVYRHRFLLGNSYRNEDEERAFIQDMKSHGVHGLIVAASDIRKTHFIHAAEQGMIIATYDNRLSESVPSPIRYFDSISMDNIEAGRIATQHLLDCGCRELVFATESSLTLGRSHKIQGFQSAIKYSCHIAQGRTLEGKAYSAYGDTEMFDLGVMLAPKIIAMTPRPDGIVAINDALAIGLMVGLRSAGCSIPADISVVGIDNISLSALVSPCLTSVMPPLTEMAELIVTRLIQRIENPTLPTEEFLFTPKLISRDSVKQNNI